MVVGLETFARTFSADTDQYVLVGGGAVVLHLQEAGFRARATKDLDLVLTAQALDSEFVERFWEFIGNGQYERWEKSDGEPVRFRFLKPKAADYPAMIELLGRPMGNPPAGQRVVPLRAADGLSDLSAILVDEDILQVVRDHQSVIEGVCCLSPLGLILLKARAWLDLTARNKAGELVQSSHIKKHRNDVFRMASLLAPGDHPPVPESVQGDLDRFLTLIESETHVHGDILKSLGEVLGGSIAERIQDLRIVMKL